jgi:hypothetical protein
MARAGPGVRREEPRVARRAGPGPGVGAGLDDLIDRRLTLGAANVVGKVRTVLAGMLAGADSIDDLDVLRAGLVRAG